MPSLLPASFVCFWNEQQTFSYPNIRSFLRSSQSTCAPSDHFPHVLAVILPSSFWRHRGSSLCVCVCVFVCGERCVGVGMPFQLVRVVRTHFAPEYSIFINKHVILKSWLHIVMFLTSICMYFHTHPLSLCLSLALFLSLCYKPTWSHCVAGLTDRAQSYLHRGLPYDGEHLRQHANALEPDCSPAQNSLLVLNNTYTCVHVPTHTCIPHILY